MTDSAREHLLGYLLGALDDAERELVETHRQSEADLRRDLAVLRGGMKPLEASREDFSPPVDLAARTCRFVAAQSREPVQPVSQVVEPAASRPTIISSGAPPAWINRVRWQNMAVAIGIFVAAVLLIVPAVQRSRVQARLMACQDNLRQIGMALTQYSQQHHGFFPHIPTQGKLAAAGLYAPTLVSAGFLNEPRRVVCPASTLAEDRHFRVPTLEEIRATTTAEQLERLRRTMGGSYGYNLGHRSGGHSHGTKNIGRENFAMMADAPSKHLPGRQSANHGGRGQNVLFENGQVRFVTSPRPNPQADDFFLNDDGFVAAGTHRNDSVVGASDSKPILPVMRGEGKGEGKKRK